MSNTLTALQPILFSAAQTVSKEACPMINAIDMRFQDQGVAYGDVVKVPVVSAKTSTSYTPAMTTTAGTDQTPTTVSVSLSANEFSSFNLTGEDQQSLDNGGQNAQEFMRQSVEQSIRVLRNNMEKAANLAGTNGASRATGTAGTAPFASDLSDLIAVRKILFDNGAPFADAHVVLDSVATNKLRALGVYQNAYQAGTNDQLRTGVVDNKLGFAIHETAWATAHTKGTLGASPVTSGSTAVGVTAITVAGGSGTIVAGDVITFAADSANKYVINSSAVSSGTGIIGLGRPGARVTIATSNAITMGNNYTSNLAFERSAIVGISRAPIIPASPLIEQTYVSDEYGMQYLVCKIIGDGMVTYRVHACYGFQAVNPEHIAIILG